MFILILNLVSGLVYALSLPGTQYTNVAYQSSNVTDYEARFNTTSLIDRWTATPFSGIPVIGDIFSGLSLVWNGIRFLVMGFPDTVQRMAGYIADPAGRTAFLLIMNVIRALFSFIMFFWVAQFITGRSVE